MVGGSRGEGVKAEMQARAELHQRTAETGKGGMEQKDLREAGKQWREHRVLT